MRGYLERRKTAMDDRYDDLEIGMSTTSKGIFRQPPSADSYRDAVESEEYDDYDYDDDDDNEDDDDAKMGLACPFCLEDFDILGLCCHIDLEHHREAKAAICPVCVTKVETSMVVHLITQHETILKILSKKKLHKDVSCSAFSLLKKELQDEQLHSPLKGSSSVASSSNTEADSLLLSFVHNPLPSHGPEITSPSSKASLSSSSSYHDTLERDVKISALPDKDQERVQRCKFLHGLLFSTIIHDDL